MYKALQYYVGCSGWSYTSWEGPFYSQNTENFRWLNYYSHVFDYVEIDSSFYKTPNKQMVMNWAKKTPNNFKFTAKFPKAITHDKRLKDVDDELERFFDAMEPLENKTLALLIQLPPYIQIHTGLERLRELVHKLDTRFRYAIEVRHPSWFQDLSYSFFANNDICLVWSQLAELQTPPVVTTDFLYLRFIGDRSIQEKDFGRIQIDRIVEMQKWAHNIKNVREDGRVKQAIIAANNHYAGFGPGTANIFRNMLGLSEAKWKEVEMEQEEKDQRDSGTIQNLKQRAISDFFK
ncbi:DUF72 domain-containing protein [Nitrososphaera sp. AFS]|uniref:DUF72 domain-containing protein n=1 Tax=Nitrososphaera sp. AFS TaxID=2301191 RepID=UPI0019172C87